MRDDIWCRKDYELRASGLWNLIGNSLVSGEIRELPNLSQDNGIFLVRKLVIEPEIRLPKISTRDLAILKSRQVSLGY